MSALFLVDPSDGGVLRAGEFTEDDQGVLVYLDDHGDFYSVAEDGESLIDLDPAVRQFDLSTLADADQGAPDFDSMSEGEMTVFAAFLENTNDPSEAVEQYNAWSKHAAAVLTGQAAADDAEDDEQALLDFLEDAPAGMVGDPDFDRLLNTVGDLDQAASAWMRGRTLVAEAKEKLGVRSGRTFDDAFLEIAAEKAAAAADTPVVRTEVPRGYGNDLDAAVDDWVVNDIGMENRSREAAELRAKIEMQETRGRSAG